MSPLSQKCFLSITSAFYSNRTYGRFSHVKNVLGRTNTSAIIYRSMSTSWNKNYVKSLKELFNFKILGFFTQKVADKIYYSALKSMKIVPTDANSLFASEKLLQAIQIFKRCPKANQLLEELRKSGIKIGSVSKEEAPAGAVAWIESRTIGISEKLTKDEMINALLFELINFERSDQLNKIHQNMEKMTPREYALNVERYEYVTAKMTHEILQQAVKDRQWPAECSQYEWQFSKENPENWNTFEGYLKTQEKTCHTDLYEQQWYEKCNPEGYPKWYLEKLPLWLKKHNSSQSEKNRPA